MNSSTADNFLKYRKWTQRASGPAKTAQSLGSAVLLLCPTRTRRTLNIQHWCEEKEQNTDDTEDRSKGSGVCHMRVNRKQRQAAKYGQHGKGQNGS